MPPLTLTYRNDARRCLTLSGGRGGVVAQMGSGEKTTPPQTEGLNDIYKHARHVCVPLWGADESFVRSVFHGKTRYVHYYNNNLN